jgi:hypothetical protein
MLLKPRLEPALSFFGWNCLRPRIAKVLAVRRDLTRRDARVLIQKVTPHEGASSNSTNMTTMISSVAIRVTAMPARVATSMPSTVAPSACK